MNNIVAGVDFTDRSRSALAEGIRLARSAGGGAMVHAVHIVDRTALEDMRLAPSRGESQESREGKLLLDTKRLIEEHVNEHADDRTESPLTVEVLPGRPGDAILEYARSIGADLIVLARNSASDPSRGAGSTALHVVRHAACDVLLVGDGHVGPFRKIVSCVDFADYSRLAMEAAERMASQDDQPSELHLVHAYQPYWDVIHLGAIPMDATGELQAEHRAQLEDRLSKIAQSMSRNIGHPVHHHIVPAGSAGSALVAFLEESHADLAVVASHGRTGLTRLLLGSTAERIIRDAHCSVLTVKRHQRGENPE